MKTVRFMLLPLLIVTIIALFAMTGCTTGGTSTETVPVQAAAPGELSQQEIEQIYQDSITNQMNLNYYKFDMDMDIDTDVIGEESGKVTVATESSGSADMISKHLQMQMQMDMTMEGLGYEGGSQSMSYDVYQMTDWIYMRMEVPGMGEQWVKMPVSEEMTQQIGLVNQQFEPLEGAVDIELRGYANVDGEECYVLSLVPDMEKLLDWISQQQGSSQGFDFEDVYGDFSDIFKSLDYSYYVTKDTKMPKRLVINMVAEFTPEQMGESTGIFDLMTMNISMDMTLYDFNIPFTIVLPDEAEDAQLMSENMFQ